jgi:transcriptional regulator with PAS, ATPase and Fis domain
MRGEDVLASIVGESAPMRRLKACLPKLAACGSTVLITGETGCGKELVAEALHRLSPRCQRPLVFVNCAALPDGLLESELFGFERGAFTGAISRSQGLLKHAEGGTVVLDEIGDMSLLTQSKLLRVLETRQVHRLGASRPDRLDVRFIAATNQKLETLVSQHRFRSDLFYRLNVVRVELPALRERREDVPLLVQSLLATLLAGRPAPRLDAPAVDALLRYDWPGNVRELRNILECICVDAPELVTLAHLPAPLRPVVTEPSAAPLTDRELIMSALLATNWNKTQAAARLHWSRMTLYRKLHKYNLDQ